MCGNAGSRRRDRLGRRRLCACHVRGGSARPTDLVVILLASRLVKFSERCPDLDLQRVATARLFSLSKREALLAISLSMPKQGRIVGRKLLDDTLGFCATSTSLDGSPKIASRHDRQNTVLSGPLRSCCSRPSSTISRGSRQGFQPDSASANPIAQLNATLSGFGIAVLPHFVAGAHPKLVPVLKS
jgi:DNA-binding transcriptional LysR family regulator